jgi:hypothetical protein
MRKPEDYLGFGVENIKGMSTPSEGDRKIAFSMEGPISSLRDLSPEPSEPIISNRMATRGGLETTA